MFPFKIAQYLQHSSEVCLDVGLQWDVLTHRGSWLPQGSLSPEVSFLFHNVGFYNCWTVHEIIYFSYLFWSNTLRGFVKVNPAFITSCSLPGNLGIILLLISPVEMKLLWIGIGLVEANIQTTAFSSTGKDASLQSPQISFEWESCCSCLSARDWTA